MPDGGILDGGDGGPNGGTGMVIVGGMVTNCPTVTSLSIQPNELDVGAGGTATLTATVTLPIEGGAPVLSWSAPSGIFGQPDSATTTFQCTVPGVVTITVIATYDGCGTSLSGMITCLAGDGG
jgi:hypothetical protein